MFPKNDPDERESPTIKAIPLIANTIDKKLINEKIAIYEKRQRNSQAWQDAVKYLEHYYSDKNRKKISIK